MSVIRLFNPNVTNVTNVTETLPIAGNAISAQPTSYNHTPYTTTLPMLPVTIEDRIESDCARTSIVDDDQKKSVRAQSVSKGGGYVAETGNGNIHEVEAKNSGNIGPVSVTRLPLPPALWCSGVANFTDVWRLAESLKGSYRLVYGGTPGDFYMRAPDDYMRAPDDGGACGY